MTSNSNFVCPPVIPSSNEALEATENRIDIKDTLVCCQMCNGLGRILKSKAATPAVGGEADVQTAKAMYDWQYGAGAWDSSQSMVREHYIGLARAALAAQPASPLPAVGGEAELREQLHYMTGTCELAMKHRDIAEAKLAALPASAVGGHMQRSELDDASNACLELCAKHGFATGHGDTVADMIREIDGQIATPAVDLKPVAWRVDSKRKSQPNIWFYYEPEWPAMHEKQGDIVTPLYAAPPASPLRESVNDKVREIVYQMTPADQYDLAFKVAENVGYMLVREPDHPDSPHLTSPPEQPAAGTGRDDVIAECAAIADKYDDCGGSFIAQKIRDLY